jgi:L-alanine-DL-glutamate epimerase-like enolase superfamily enzyme
LLRLRTKEGLKVTVQRVEAFPLAYPEPHDSNKPRHVTLVKLTTFDGVVGWGECIAQWPEAALAVKTIVERGMADLVVGSDPQDVELTWQRMRQHSFWYGNGGIASLAISAIDMALWDLKGKINNVPVYQLLGGRKREQIRACASVIFDTENLELTRDEFSDYVERGYTAVKGGWGKSRETAFGLDEKRDMTVVQTIREAVGPDIDIVIDVGTHVEWSLQHAIHMIRRFEDYELFWIEEPLPQDDLDGLRRLRESITTPIASGEKEWTLRAFKDLIQSGGVDIVMPDPGKAEGITGFKKIVDFAAAGGFRFTPHSWSTAINTAAAVHLFTACTNGVVFELKPNVSPMQNELVANPIQQHGGWVELPSGPGLGVEVDGSVVQKYTIN